jgi:hypothetical protein
MHWISEEWAIDANSYTLSIDVLINFIKINKLTTKVLNFSEIAYKGNVDRHFIRYQMANTNYPMIVSQMDNPCGKKYRLIDGRHRIHKLMDEGKNEGLFYEIPMEFILKNIKLERAS